MLRSVLALTLSVTAVNLSAQTRGENVVITLERTGCYGSCPVYKLAIHEDGSVVYEGKQFVRVTGKREAAVNRADVARLVQTLIDAGYFDFKDSYSSIENPDGTVTIVTDLPTTYTSLTVGERKKRIEDYVGAPKKLRELEHQIDALAGGKRWVSIDAATVHEECKRGWSIRAVPAKILFLDAARRGDLEVVRAFLDEGADVNSRVGLRTALQEARGAEVVGLLTARGADVNVGGGQEFGPPIVRAAEFGDADSILVLIRAGAKVDRASKDGTTALMEAARSGRPEAVQALLGAGARVNLQNKYGEDALGFARLGLEGNVFAEEHPDPFREPLLGYRNKFKQIEQMLLAAGAIPKTTRQ